jgi:virginiamycin B lyase
MTLAGVPTPFTFGTQTFGIAPGPDGNVWVTDTQNDQVEQIAPSGSVLNAYSLGSTGRPMGITAGPDGALWVAQDIQFQGQTPAIARITTTGAVSSFPIAQRPYRIVTGKDGNLWYSESFGNGIARITPTGTVTEFQAAVGAAVYGIAAAADGSLWATELSGNAIDHFSSSGVLLNRYPLPTPNSGPMGVTMGPDGNVWFVEQAGRIGVLTP